MRWPLLLLVLALVGPAAAQETPDDQTLVFYNARVALREKRPTDVLKLWLLRNGLAQKGQAGTQDAAFRSVVWAALGELGMCQEGFPRDEGGAGLWTLALHNQVLHTLQRGPPPPAPSPFEAFSVGRQQRFISLHDVLSAAELRSATFFRTDCLLPHLLLLEEGASPWVDLTDRLETGLLMQRLLERARTSLVRERVRGVATVEARLFDLELVLSELQARKSRREGQAARQHARSVGVSPAGAAEVEKAASRWPAKSRQAAFLRRSLTWTASDWLGLSRERRLFLFAQARPLSQDAAALQRLVLDIVDGLIARREGEEVETWLGHLEAGEDLGRRSLVTAGERGLRLLELEARTGFRERPVVALHRGVAFLEAGELQEALRSFAYALRHAEESREATTTLALSRRWLSYVLSRFETSQEVVATLKALVPRQEANALLEELIWRAALRADAGSFRVATASIQRGGALDGRVARLRPLAEGRPGELAAALRKGLSEEPALTLRFVRTLLEKLEAEEAQVRRASVPFLQLLSRHLQELAAKAGTRSAHGRTAEELLGRVQGILEGLSELDTSVAGQARGLSPAHETFAGSVRLAPSDALPWPFRVPQVDAPSVFEPLLLVPVEWRDAQGGLVFGWRITE